MRASSVFSFGSIGAVERPLSDRLDARLDKNGVAPERREQERRVNDARNGQRRALEFWRKPTGVDGVCAGVRAEVRGATVAACPFDRLGTGDNIVTDGTDTGRRCGRGNVDDDHLVAGVREGGGEARSVTDSDLDKTVVPSENVGQGAHDCGTFSTQRLCNQPMLVDIVPVGGVNGRVMTEASSALQSVYDVDVSVHDNQAIPEGAFDRSRNQYRAEEFIELASRVGSGDKNIGVTSEDLYYRRRNYVFGLAYLNGNGSVISTYRLQTSSDGGVTTKPQSEVFDDRVRKEVVHEVGHTFGLEHCDNDRCVMSFSPTVREVDVKEENLCGSCSRLLR